MNTLLSSGHIVDIALVFIALEFVFLLLRAPHSERSAQAIALIHILGPGVCLMLALRCAMTDASALWIGFWLTASLPLHIWDVLTRRL
jgi:hypothetical protein